MSDSEKTDTEDEETLNMAFTKAELQLYHAMHELNDFEKGEIATVAGTCLYEEYNLAELERERERVVCSEVKCSRKVCAASQWQSELEKESLTHTHIHTHMFTCINTVIRVVNLAAETNVLPE